MLSCDADIQYCLQSSHRLCLHLHGQVILLCSSQTLTSLWIKLFLGVACGRPGPREVPALPWGSSERERWARSTAPWRRAWADARLSVRSGRQGWEAARGPCVPTAP